MIGSTANIVAIGMLEKRAKVHIKFFEWLKIGALSAFAAMLLAWILLVSLKGLCRKGLIFRKKLKFNHHSTELSSENGKKKEKCCACFD